MALEYSRLFNPSELTTSLATIFTLGTSGDGRVLRNGAVLFHNRTGGAVTVTAHIVPSGGSAGNTNVFMTTESIPANARLEVTLPKMKGGDFLQCLASANNSIVIHELDGVPRV